MKHKPSVSSLPFTMIPRQPPVFVHYVSGSPDVLPFYRHPPDLAALNQAVRESRDLGFPRREVAELLKVQNESFGAGEDVLQAIENLAEPDCVAILTGQQVGIFTGPVLTIYKALTALRLNQELRRQGIRCVAVFWLASDDHDLAEVTRIVLPGGTSEIRGFDSRELLFGSTDLPPRPVGSIALTEKIRELVEAYVASFPDASGRELAEQLRSACAPGRTFSQAFGSIMTQLFRGKGLILFDPRDRPAKELASPVIRKALLGQSTLRSILSERNQALQNAGFEIQVSGSPRSTHIFLEENGERRLLISREGAFTIKDCASCYEIDQLLSLTDSDPERFSPNVLLRPIVQDHLFPTVAYVGGPAEISYFAQIEPFYRYFGRPMPVIWPRSSFTLLEAYIHPIMDHYAVDLQDCFQGEGHVFQKILQVTAPDFSRKLAELSRRMDQGIDELRPALTAADASLGPAAETVRRKLHHRMESMSAKFVSREMRQNHALMDVARHMMNACYPEGHLQERGLGVHYLMARLGTSLLDTLYSMIGIGPCSHSIVRF